jgi:hypothetical protein
MEGRNPNPAKLDPESRRDPTIKSISTGFRARVMKARDHEQGIRMESSRNLSDFSSLTEKESYGGKGEEGEERNKLEGSVEEGNK